MLLVVVVFCSKAKIGPEWWALYMKKDGCFTFQIDLAQALINYAIENEWEDVDGLCPNWMRQTDFIPCDCKNCFFCLKGLTTVIAHKKQKKTCTTFVQRDNMRTVQKGCTDKLVGLMRGKSWCRMCYRNQSNGTTEERARRKRRTIAMGLLWGVCHVMSICVRSVGQRGMTCMLRKQLDRSKIHLLIFLQLEKPSITLPNDF
jgi:hypothetical protein